MTMRTHTHDPFGWRLEELARPDLHPVRRTALLDDLLVAEAEELAHGRRHLTIIHGEPADIAEAEALNDFYDEVAAIVESSEWSRVVGGPEYVTVTVVGSRRDELLSAIAERAFRAGCGRWKLLERP